MELENLVKLIQTVSDSDLTGFQYEENGVKLKIQKEKEQMVVSTGAAQLTTVQNVPGAQSNAVSALKSEDSKRFRCSRRNRRKYRKKSSGWNLLCSTVGRGSTICGSWRSCVKRTDGCHRRGDEADE